MANLQGTLLICVNENATEQTIEAFRKLAIGAFRKKGIDETKIKQILATEKVVKVGEMVDSVNGKDYPTSPFELVIEHDQCLPFSTKGEKPSLRFATNLTKLMNAKKVMGKYDRVAYAHSRRVSCFDGDNAGIERLTNAAAVAEKLYTWKQHIKTALAELELQPRDVSRYDLKETLGDDYVGMTPYCVTLPDVTSGIILFVAAVETKNGKYLKQEFAFHFNVGLTHTGSGDTNSDKEIDSDCMDEFYALIGGTSEKDENPDLNNTNDESDF